jgi:hydrocephalus-inducing protein
LEEVKALDTRVVAISDHPKYECPQAPIVFKNTLMFQSRSFSLPLKNTCNATIDIVWSTVPADPDDDDEPPFTITPEASKVQPGETQLFTVKFAPLEAEKFKWKLVGKIPWLHSSLKQPSIDLIGESSRPLCHFELLESDYISGGRRNSELRGPDGKIGPLDPRTKVIEFRSVGVKTKSVKKFYILNPTNLSYEFYWEESDVASQSQSFHCVTKKGLVVSGKKFEVVFEYTPQDLGLKVTELS